MYKYRCPHSCTFEKVLNLPAPTLLCSFFCYHFLFSVLCLYPLFGSTLQGDSLSVSTRENQLQVKYLYLLFWSPDLNIFEQSIYFIIYLWIFLLFSVFFLIPCCLIDMFLCNLNLRISRVISSPIYFLFFYGKLVFFLKIFLLLISLCYLLGLSSCQFEFTCVMG